MKRWIAGILLLPFLSAPLVADELDDLIAEVNQVGAKAKNAASAAAAWEKLSSRPASDLPKILAAISSENPLGANYLRSAVDTIAERAVAGDEKLPQEELVKFIKDTDHDPRARRLAFEWLIQISPEYEERLVSKMAADPSVEFRRDAVELRLKQAREAKREETRIAMFRGALSTAVDDDQVKEATAALRDLGEKVDTARHYGLLTSWHIVGPFDNKDEEGYSQARGPEGKPINLDEKFQGSHDTGEVSWAPHTTDDDYGKVDLTKVLDKHKGAIAYAYTEFVSAKEQQVQFRLTSKNACKLWLNGKLIDAREVYHAGGAFDQYISSGTIQQGKNKILLKVCQNEQDQPWAQDWAFQLRVSDTVGSGILSTDRE